MHKIYIVSAMEEYEQQKAQLLDYRVALEEFLEHEGWQRNNQFPTSKRHFDWTRGYCRVSLYFPTDLGDYKDDFHMSIHSEIGEWKWKPNAYDPEAPWPAWTYLTTPPSGDRKSTLYSTFDEWEIAMKEWVCTLPPLKELTPGDAIEHFQ